MGIFGEPAVTGDLEEICSFPWIWDQNTTKKVASMRSDIFGECERSRDNVLVEQVDVVSFRVGRIIIERKITSQHGVL